MNGASTVTFAGDLRRHGDRLAVIGPDGTALSYRELDRRVADTEARLGARRRLVLIAASNTVESVVAYLAALRAGHPVLLAGAGRADALVTAYDPDVVCGEVDGRWGIEERRAGSAHVLHPELALLLSTSGSSGSPKLVRLSVDNVESNARAIADYLDIRPTDRAMASLPMHYCYGLSVINSNCARGAAVVLSDRSVLDPQLWAAVRRHGVTSLHGVPYTFELLDQVGFPDMRVPSLRYLTQAGGRLAPATVRRYAELGARDGWRLFVMYGQTEATARMAYLPPELAAERPAVVGRPIPGGRFTIEPAGADEADGAGGAAAGPEVGELVYEGPNVMLGYAQAPADLAAGRTVTRLRTGDLGRRRPDGLYEVVGRRGRVVKPFGLRVDLEHVEQLLADEGCTVACAGDDTELTVLAAGAPDAGALRRLVAERLGLPAGRVRVVCVEELPRRPNGKIDHERVARLCRRPDRSRTRVRAGPGAGSRTSRRRPRSVRDAFRAVFPVRDLPPDASFVSLGGDSLCYVQLSVALQRVLGHLPPDWSTCSIRRLEAVPHRRAPWARVETAVALRAVAIVLVVGSHVGLFRVLGGAHVLLAVAGFVFARFVLAEGNPTTPSRAVLRSLVRIAVPSAVWIAMRSLVQHDVDAANALLLNYWIDPAAWGYWFVESLSQSLALLAVVFAVPAVRRAERARPFPFAVGVLAVASLGRLYPDHGNEFSDRLMSTHLVLWIFALGWVAQRASSPRQRVLTAALALALVPGFFPAEPARAAVVAAGMVLLLVPRIVVPQAVLAPLGALAGASLAIYLTHYAVYPGLLTLLPPLAVTVLCLLLGIVAEWAVTGAVRAGWGLCRARRRPRPRRAASPSGHP